MFCADNIFKFPCYLLYFDQTFTKFCSKREEESGFKEVATGLGISFAPKNWQGGIISDSDDWIILAKLG